MIYACYFLISLFLCLKVYVRARVCVCVCVCVSQVQTWYILEVIYTRQDEYLNNYSKILIHQKKRAKYTNQFL